MGIPVDRVVSFTFVLGSALAAAAGFLYAMKYPGLNQPAHTIWVLLGLKAFVAAVIGGIGNVRGAVLGGFVIAFVEQFGAFYMSSNYRDVYVFALLIVILLVRPTACWARRCRRRCDRDEQPAPPPQIARPPTLLPARLSTLWISFGRLSSASRWRPRCISRCRGASARTMRGS